MPLSAGTRLGPYETLRRSAKAAWGKSTVRVTQAGPRRERPSIRMLLSVCDNDAWKDASLDWVEEKQDGAVEVIATAQSGLTLALEHYEGTRGRHVGGGVEDGSEPAIGGVESAGASCRRRGARG